MKYIYTFLFVVISATSFAQGNLQFNKVVSFNGTIIGSFVSARIPLDTVAAGKVIKVTSLNTSSGYLRLIINDVELSNSGNYNFPIWLKEGDILTAGGGCSCTCGYHVSGIEFNIIP